MSEYQNIDTISISLKKDRDIVANMREMKRKNDSAIDETSFKIDIMRKALDAQIKDRLDEELAVHMNIDQDISENQLS